MRVVFATLLLAIMFLLSKGSNMSWEGTNMSWEGGIPQRIVLRLLGTSGGAGRSRGTFQDSWKGRLLYLRDEIKALSDKTTAETDAKIKSLETTLSEKISAASKDDDATLQEIMGMLRVMQAKIEVSGK